jgi:hypothetical protein
MGGGETLVNGFWEWWEQQNWCEDERAGYFPKKAWPPPPRWIPWMAIRSGTSTLGKVRSNSILPHTLSGLGSFGFKGMERRPAHDLDDEKWLRG